MNDFDLGAKSSKINSKFWTSLESNETKIEKKVMENCVEREKSVSNNPRFGHSLLKLDADQEN